MSTNCRKRLLAENMLASGQGKLSPMNVERIRGCNINGIDLGICKQGFIRSIRSPNPVAISKSARPVQIARDNCFDDPTTPGTWGASIRHR
jgi:hypothetical protein